MQKLNIIGLNSGTSLDGVDAAICSIEKRDKFYINYLNGTVLDYPDIFRKKLKKILTNNSIGLYDLCMINAQLGDYFLDATKKIIKESSLNLSDIHLIGSHGQTFWHSPNKVNFLGRPTKATLQLGDPSIIAEKTKIPVVCDFRVQDICADGQGAPLIAFLDKVLFGSDNISSGILNVGGIANITYINSRNQVKMAFDTGPGNMIIDQAAKLLYGKEYDENGYLASLETYDKDTLDELMQSKYFSQTPPKTTGRELFGYTYANDLLNKLDKYKLSKEKIMATVTAFTAYSICDAYKKFILSEEPITRLIISGGGAYNKTIIKLLHDFFPHKIDIISHDLFNIPIKFKEAVLFALLAYTRYFEIPNNIPLITGAKSKVIMGKIIKPY